MNLSEKQFSKINTLLLILIILINLYVVLGPFIPGLQFWYKTRYDREYQETLTQQLEGDPSQNYQGPNKIVIPSLFIDQPILEGENIYTAARGIWRLPWTSTPDKGSNTVLIGHRFMYSQTPAVFYNLDKLKVGDKIGVFWDNQRIIYEVGETKIVTPQQMEVESPSEEDILTLYTCTPLWTSNNRLVIIADKVGN